MIEPPLSPIQPLSFSLLLPYLHGKVNRFAPHFCAKCIFSVSPLARPTVSRAAAYIPQRQEDGLQFYTGAAYATYRQNGTLWVTGLRTGETHDTGVSADAPYHICTVGEDISVVQEQ